MNHTAIVLWNAEIVNEKHFCETNTARHFTAEMTPYPTHFLFVIHFRYLLALSVGSFAQNLDDNLFICTKSFHSRSPETNRFCGILCFN
jgi:hypothetical protein